jgi:hypothetical protein
MTALESAGLLGAGPEAAGITDTQLLEWYFGEQLGWLVPRDLAGYARTLGFTDRREFTGTLLREYCYLKLTQTPRAPAASSERGSA